MGLITYVGINAVIKVKATGARLLLVVVVFGIAFGAASLLRLPATRQSGRTEMRWLQWLLSRNSPVVLCKRNTGDPTYYVVLLAGRRQV